jgi:hypothetical protein
MAIKFLLLNALAGSQSASTFLTPSAQSKNLEQQKLLQNEMMRNLNKT